MVSPPAFSIATQWFHLERIFGPAARRERHIDPDANVDWELTDHYVRVGALAVGCALLEDAGLKAKDEHVRLLFEIRNALIHNAGDMALNRNTKALGDAQRYLSNASHATLSPEIGSPFFSLTGTVVELQPSIYFSLRLCMLQRCRRIPLAAID